ncbi:autotransporter assembly complex protein TamA [Dechloromonas denitrificans]|uniref:autotransporter assembly complex protein TamA n=1 Tax=Dechloromonas denitrificans TaxID=281362 RepID=UPI001CFAD6AB|nr:autotransporter assembly complex family protein [Dechloromonas denitrificans]
MSKASAASRRLFPMLLMALAAPLAAGEIELQATDAISELLTPYLPAEAGSRHKLEEQLGEILATEGYFSPRLEFADSDDRLLLKVDPGPRTIIGQVDVTIDGPLAAETQAALIAGWPLPVGRPFRQADWNTAKQQVLGELLATEHAGARLVDSAAEIDTASQRATLSAHYDAGPRYRFGELRITGLQRYTPDLIERYNRVVHAGEPYRADRLNTLQSTLQATPYFASVQATLDPAATDADTDADGTITAPVLLAVRERQPHRIGFGAGASSNTGARVEVNYQTPNLFSQAWELNSGVRLEQKRQTAYADVFLPPDSKNRRHSVGLMAEGSDIQGLRTERYAFGAQTVQQRGSIEQRLSLNWQEERRNPDGAPETTSRALVPNVMWTWRRVDSLLDPHHGIVLQAQVGGGAKAALSDQNFVRLHGRWLQYVPLGRVDTLTLRGEVGYTQADSRRRIPQDYLFRTGGTGTVRGYAYQSLGIKEGAATVGGRYLGVVSAEATHWLNDSWGIAAFVDAGDAIDDLADIKLAVGYGLGARWRSPAGPIGVDLAYGQRTGEVQLHFSLAIPF